MKVIALINAAAGTRGGDDRLAEAREALAKAGVEADVRPTEGANLTDAARAALAQGADVVIAGGGDGTVSAVAGVLAGTPALLGVLPMGTLNHFARDMRVPPRPEHAARLIADALRDAEPSPAGRRVHAVDVGDVNGRCFVNNASIGLYPHIVSKRERQQERFGRNKWVAMFVAIVSVFRRYPL